jgi:hypothetical protein
VVVGTLLVTTACLVFGFFWFVVWEITSTKQKKQKITRTVIPLQSIKNTSSLIYDGHRTMNDLIEDIFPDELRINKWYILLWKKLQKEHILLLSLFYIQKNNQYNLFQYKNSTNNKIKNDKYNYFCINNIISIKWMKLIYHILILLFINT